MTAADEFMDDWRKGFRARLRALHQLVVDTPGIRTADVVESYSPGADAAQYSLIYQTLKKLEDDGLVHSRTDRPGTRWYSIADPEEPDDDED